jgi:3-hydroxyacyl-[acyl-carrier-protein] dehydratase
MRDEFTPIKELLPHREPFLFIDELLTVSEEKTVAKKHFSSDEYFFKGHFPDHPVVPGVILVETMAQCGGAGLLEAGILEKDSFFVLASVEKAKFRNQVRPEDTAIIEVENLRASKQMMRQKGKIIVNGVVAAEATWMCIVGSKDLE